MAASGEASPAAGKGAHRAEGNHDEYIKKLIQERRDMQSSSNLTDAEKAVRKKHFFKLIQKHTRQNLKKRKEEQIESVLNYFRGL